MWTLYTVYDHYNYHGVRYLTLSRPVLLLDGSLIPVNIAHYSLSYPVLHPMSSTIILLWKKVHLMIIIKLVSTLTHWGRVTHICVSKLTIIGSDNGVSPGRWQAIIWTNAGILLIRNLGTNFNEILTVVRFHSRKCIWKCFLRNGVHFVSASLCSSDLHWNWYNGILSLDISGKIKRVLNAYLGHWINHF